MSEPVFRKSTFSNNGDCVEVADVADDVAIRNSKSPDAGTLTFGREGFAAWIEGCRNGEFDDLAG